MDKNNIKFENDNNDFEKELDLNKPFSMMKSINSIDILIKEIFKEINVWEDPSESLSKKIADNHAMQMKLENTFVGKIWPALLENAKFLRIMNSLNRKKELLSRIIEASLPIEQLHFNPIIILVMITFLFVISVTYYQYTKPQSNPTNIIANEESPTIKLIPSPTDKPIATSNPIQTINPDIAKSPENNKDNIRQDATKENNQQATTNKDTKPRKSQEPIDLYKEDNNIAINNLKRDKRTNNSVKTNAITNIKKKPLTLSNLVYVAVVDLKTKDQEQDPVDVEIKQELIQAIINSGKWRLSSVEDAEAIFKKQNNDGTLVLFDKKTKNILWKSIDYINNYKNNKDYIKITVETLSNYQKQ